MEAQELLGLPLAQGLALAEAEGRKITVVESVAPRTDPRQGVQRIVRVRGDEWTVCTFLTEEPKKSE